MKHRTSNAIDNLLSETERQANQPLIVDVSGNMALTEDEFFGHKRFILIGEVYEPFMVILPRGASHIFVMLNWTGQSATVVIDGGGQTIIKNDGAGIFRSDGRFIGALWRRNPGWLS